MDRIFYSDGQMKSCQDHFWERLRQESLGHFLSLGPADEVGKPGSGLGESGKDGRWGGQR